MKHTNGRTAQLWIYFDKNISRVTSMTKSIKRVTFLFKIRRTSLSDCSQKTKKMRPKLKKTATKLVYSNE